MAEDEGSATAPPAISTPPPDSPPSSPIEQANLTSGCELSDTEQALLDAHNQARALSRDCGDEAHPAVGALAWQCTLAEVSESHSLDMATINFFSHTGSDGLSPFDRMTNAGYEYRTAGENIAAGQRDVAQVMDGWLNSPGHCQNIMNGSFTEMGGAKVDASGSDFATYWTVKFGG
ncbi:MAG: CAP domain-containing protein [Pseudomonadota bacterium]